MAEEAATATMATTAAVQQLTLTTTTRTPAASHPATASSSSPPSKEPVALATTKRKFHKLLEGLSKAPSKAASSDSAAKRIRLQARARLDSSISAHSTSKDSVIQRQLLSTRLAAASKHYNDSQSSKKGSPSPNNSTESSPLANSKYVPWSHAHFLARLQSFADLRQWTSKPDAVNEVQWSKRGWVCEGVNTVACKGGCEQRVVVALRPRRKDADGHEIEDSEDYSVEVNDNVVEKFKDLIIKGHDMGCLWYAGGCKDDIHRLPLARPEKWQPELKERYKSFSALHASSLPSPDRLVNPLNMELMLSSLQPGFFYDTSAATNATEPQSALAKATLDASALALSLTGWTVSASSSAEYPLASCEACFRRLGLWLYASTTSSTSAADSDQMKLDLLDNHRDYCPWIKPASQCGAGAFAGLAGWEILQRVVANDASFHSHDEGAASPAAALAASGEDKLSASLPVDRDKEDRARFARLKELTKSMGLKTLRRSKLLTSAIVQDHGRGRSQSSA